MGCSPFKSASHSGAGEPPEDWGRRSAGDWGAVSLQGCRNSDGSVSHNGVFNQGVTGAGQGAT
jgi:hypothetical protein